MNNGRKVPCQLKYQPQKVGEELLVCSLYLNVESSSLNVLVKTFLRLELFFVQYWSDMPARSWVFLHYPIVTCLSLRFGKSDRSFFRNTLHILQK